MARFRCHVTPGEQDPLKERREHWDWPAEETLSGRHQQALAGIQGPCLSGGNRLLPLGCQGQRYCLDIPQTQHTQGWWCPSSTNHDLESEFHPHFITSTTLHTELLPGGGHVV